MAGGGNFSLCKVWQGSYKQCRRVLQQAFQVLDHLRRILAVNDTVIEAGGEVHHPADDHRVIPDHGTLLRTVDPDNGHFRTVDDRDTGQTSEFAQAGDAYGGSSHFLTAEGVVP